jgi:tRNA-modifying protein YgfZ
MAEQSPLHAWQIDAGANLVRDAGMLMPADFGDPQGEYHAARSHAAVFDLSHRGTVALSGADCVAFLHNLCTNDIKKLAPGCACEFFLTTHKARVVGHGFAHRLLPADPPRLLLDVTPGTGQQLASHLDRYIVSEQAEVADQSGRDARIHVCGPDALGLLPAAAGTLAGATDLQSVGIGSLRVTRHDRLAMPGWDAVGPGSELTELIRSLVAKGCTPAGNAAYNVLRIEAGVPVEGVDFDSERFVVEIGRAAQAISYTKGCYLGQEPIVMARDRGHANRILCALKIAGAEPVAAGAKVTSGAEEAGEVTSAVFSPRVGSAVALAYLKRGMQMPGLVLAVTGRSALVASAPIVSS